MMATVNMPLPLPRDVEMPLTAAPGRERCTAEPAVIAGLMRRAVADDPEAFREIVERYQHVVFAIIRRIVPEESEADDIAQQVFVNVYFGLKKFDFRSSFYCWLYRITVNECFDWIRRRNSWRRHFEAEPAEESRRRELDRVPDDRVCRFDRRIEIREIVVKLLSGLPNSDQQLLMMKECEGYHTNEMAQMLGINENTIKVRLLRARRRLAQAAEVMGLAPDSLDNRRLVSMPVSPVRRRTRQ